MTLRFVLILSVLASMPSKADMASSYAHGQAQAKSMPQVTPNNLNPQSFIPNFQGSPEEAGLFTDSPHDAEKLRSLASQRARDSEPAQAIHNSAERSQRFTFDTKTDPLFTNAKLAVKDPMKVVSGEKKQAYEMVTEQLYETKACEESGDPIQKTCHMTLHVQIKPQEIKIHRVTVKTLQAYVYRNFCKWYPPEHLFSLHEDALKRKESIKSKMLPYITYYFPISKALTSDTPFTIHNGHENITGDLMMTYRVNVETLNPFPTHLLSHILKVVYLSSNPFELYHPFVSLGYGDFNEWSYLPEMYAKPRDLRDYFNGEFLFDVHHKDPDWPRPEDITETFTNDCDRLERKADNGLCSVIQEECLDADSTKFINGVSVTRPCWKKKITYACHTPSANNCGPLRAKGCVQVNSACSKYIGSTCVTHKQTYRCPAGTRQVARPVSSESSMYCLSGDCTTPEYHANDEMMDAISKLEIFRKIQDDVRAGSFEIFKGEDNRCSRLVMGLRDCCGGHNGWGVSLGLTKCDKIEKELAVKRQKNLCVSVGTYCAEKILGVCTKKKTSFCCFTSKIAKLLNEQARAQLGISWGSPKDPQCRGLSAEEISRIDFSRLDLSELFEEIMARFKEGKIPNAREMTANSAHIVERVRERMKHVQQDMADHKKKEL